MKFPALFLTTTESETGLGDDNFSKKLLSPRMAIENGIVSNIVFVVVSVFDPPVSTLCEQVSHGGGTKTVFSLAQRISSTIQMNMNRMRVMVSGYLPFI